MWLYLCNILERVKSLSWGIDSCLPRLGVGNLGGVYVCVCKGAAWGSPGLWTRFSFDCGGSSLEPFIAVRSGHLHTPTFQLVHVPKCIPEPQTCIFSWVHVQLVESECSLPMAVSQFGCLLILMDNVATTKEGEMKAYGALCEPRRGMYAFVCTCECASMLTYV